MSPPEFPLRSAGPRFALLLAVSLAARVAVLGNPVIHSDEQFYLAAARLWAAGGIPYVDWWDRKPIGLFLLYRLPAAIGDPGRAVLAYQLLALVAAAATAALIARLAERAGWGRGALAAAIMYLLWLDFAEGQGGQAPVFYNLPMAGTALLAGGGRPSRWAGFAAMTLVGLAAQIKYSVVFEGLWFGLWLLWRDRHHALRRRIGYAAALVAAAAAPTLLVALLYAAAGYGEAWWFANVASILRRPPDPWPEQLGNLATCIAVLAVPVGLSVAGCRAVPTVEPGGDLRRFVAGWLVAALAGVALFGTWFVHYSLPVLVPASVAAAGGLGGGGRRRSWTAALLIAAALVGQAVLAAAGIERGTSHEFAALAAAIGRGRGALYVESGPSALFTFTGRPPASRFVYPSHLARTREAPAIGVDPSREVAALFARRPAVVVMTTEPFRGEAAARRAQVSALLVAGGYHRTAVLPLGRGRLALWRLSGADK